MSKENNKVDINKHEIDIDTLKKQNVNDLLSIKELYKRIEELDEKTTQIKYIDNTLVKKLKKEYENLKRVILNENVQVELNNKIEETKNVQVELNNKIEETKTEINEVSSQMDTKANKDSVFTMANMGQDIKEAMSGGSVAVVGKDSVLEENVVDGQITARKMRNNRRTVNLFDYQNMNLFDGYFNNSGFVSASKMKTLYTPINISSNTKFTIHREKLGSRFKVATCSNVPTNGGTINTLIDNASNDLVIEATSTDKYIAVWFYNSSVDSESYIEYAKGIQIEIGNKFTEFHDYIELNIEKGDLSYNLQDELKSYNFINTIKEDLYKTSKNIFDIDNINMINALFSSTNSITINSNAYSIFVPISNSLGDNITITKSILTTNFRVGTTTTIPTAGVSINTFKATSANNITIPITANDKYLIVYLYNKTADKTTTLEDVLSNLMIEYGAVFTGHEKHTYIDVIPKDAIRPFNSNNFLKTANEPLISIVNDGAELISGLESLKNLCDELGIKCTYALLTMLVEPTHSRFNEEILNLYKQWQLEGFHITTEGETHEEHWKADKLDLSLCEKDVINGLITMRKQGFLNYEHMVVPNSIATKEMQDMIKKWCKCAITGGSKPNISYHDGRFNIHRLFIMSDASGGLGLQGYKDVIDNTIENNGWLVFGLHTSLTNEYDETLVRNVLEYAQSKGIRILPFNQAYSIKESIYTFGEIFN